VGERANSAPGDGEKSNSSVSITPNNVNSNDDELKILGEFPKDRMNNKQNAQNQTPLMTLSTICPDTDMYSTENLYWKCS
jgi:hypothetical protein